MQRDDQTANADAERRLREAFGRQPTAREIADLRLAEQSLGLGQPAFVKARQQVARAQNLRDCSSALVKSVRDARKKSRRTRNKARRTRRKPV